MTAIPAKSTFLSSSLSLSFDGMNSDHDCFLSISFS